MVIQSAITASVPQATSQWQPFVGDAHSPRLAGRLRALREAEDDAQAVLSFLFTGMATHAIDPAQVVWIIDLAPGDGERAWRVLNNLSGRAPRGAPIRYLACCSTSEHHANLAAHPFLKPLISNGSLFLDREGRGVPSHAVCNPIVVLAHEGLSSQSQGLYASHFGELLEAWSDDNGAMEWRAIGQQNGLMHLLSAYRQSLNSVAFTVPRGAMDKLAELLRVSGGRLLLRASDQGAKDMAQIRMGALSHDAGHPLRVNFEALARWHRANGASVYQTQRDDDGRVLHIALHDIAGGRLQECLPDVLSLPHPDDHVQLLQALDKQSALSPAQCLAVLHAQAGDPRALRALAGQIVHCAPTLVGTALRQWREMLACCWAQYFPPCDGDGDADDIRVLIATLALDVEDWSLARKALQSMLRTWPHNAACWYMLAQCQIRTGGARAAAISLRQALATCANGPLVTQAIEALAARMSAWRERPAFCGALAREGQLVLEPLDSQHAADMHYQYRDPQIGVMTRLPAFSDISMVCEWIAKQAEKGNRLDCAVLHATHGFVGVVSAHWEEEGAFIHFWLGADYQGKRLGVPAVRLMLRLLAAHGIRQVFTAVYPDNYRSLRTLQGLGFTQLPIRAIAPEQSMLFFARAMDDDTGTGTLCEQLREFSRVSQSIYVFSTSGEMYDNQPEISR